MATIRQIKVKDVVYDISPSPSGTLDTTTKDNAFASSDVAQASATAWTDVAALAATETNKSMFTKATQMMKNTRYLYNIIGTGFSTSSTIKKAIDGKAASNHSHDLSTMINTLSVGSATPEDADYYVCQYAGGGNTTSTYHRRPMSALWDYIKTKGNSTWQPKGSYASSTHTHKYAGSGSAGGSANSAVKLDTATAGSTTQPVYFTGGKPTAIGYTIAKSVPADAKFTDTNTWRPIQNSLGSAATDQSLSAAQGKWLNENKVLQTNWNCTIKCATWSRICYIAAHTNVTGSSFILNVAGTRGSVVYNETFAINVNHSQKSSIVKIATAKYSAIQIRVTSDANGNCYVEIYDDANKATNATTQSVTCRLIGIRVGAVTVYTAFTSGATLASGYVASSSLTVNTNSLQGNLSWGEITGKPSSFTPASHTHSSVTDNNDSKNITFAYSKAGMNYADYSWIAAWNGYELRAISKSQFAQTSHTHTKSQITDFPSSLKNPTSLTIQGNGTALATYDGSAAKTVNITKSSVGLGSVDNTADSAKTVAKANQLTTTRTVSGGTDIPLSFTYNGSANSSASIGYYSCTATGGNTSNYPWHRIAKLDTQAGAYIDQSITLYITQGYQGGGFGIIRITLRTNNSNSTSAVEARWLVRSGFSADQVQVGLYNVYGKTYADVFLKIGGYGGTTIRAIGSDARGSIKRTWNLVNSSEANDTTASDKKTSTECWASVASAATALHNQAYTNTVAGSDNGTVSYANSAGSCSSATTASKIGTGTVGASNKPVYINGGTPTACSYSLGNACSKSTRTLTAAGASGWKDATTDQGYVPDMAFMAYWNGAYSGSSSNLAYCNRGAFGTIVTKNAGDYAAASHSHKYAGSGSAGGSANSAVKLDTATAGSTTQPVYFSGGKPVAIGYTIAKSVPADAKFTDTNTWRGIQNNLTSTATDQSLSAAQGKALKDALDKKTGVSVSGNTLVFA